MEGAIVGESSSSCSRRQSSKFCRRGGSSAAIRRYETRNLSPISSQIALLWMASIAITFCSDMTNTGLIQSQFNSGGLTQL